MFSIPFFFLPIFLIPSTIILPFFLVPPVVIPAIFFNILSPLMFRPEVASAIMIPLAAIHAIFPVTIRTNFFDAVLTDTRRQQTIGDFIPGTVVMVGTMPAVAIVQIIIVRAEDDVIGRIHSHIKTQTGGRNKEWCHIKHNRWRGRHNHPGGWWRGDGYNHPRRRHANVTLTFTSACAIDVAAITVIISTNTVFFILNPLSFFLTTQHVQQVQCRHYSFSARDRIYNA